MTHRHLVDKNPMLAGLRLPAAASTPLASSFPSWSPRAHTFVSACLCLEPPSRPSAQELLNHEFFTHDCFPETFLPLLRQRVQQEFSGNSLLGNGGRRGSSTNDKKSRSRRAPGGVSPESVYGKSIARPPPTTRTDTLQPTRLVITFSPASLQFNHKSVIIYFNTRHLSKVEHNHKIIPHDGLVKLY